MPNHTNATDAPLGIAATLCRMALLRSRSLSVSGAYARYPVREEDRA